LDLKKTHPKISLENLLTLVKTSQKTMNRPSQIKNTILSQNCLLFSEAYPTNLLIKILSKTDFLSAIFFFLNQISQLASVQTQCTFMLTSAWRWFLRLTGVVLSGWLHSYSYRPNSGPNHIHTPAQFWAKTHTHILAQFWAKTHTLTYIQNGAFL